MTLNQDRIFYFLESLGMCVPCRDLVNEFDEIASELNTLVMPDIVNYLIGTMKNKMILGDADPVILEIDPL